MEDGTKLLRGVPIPDDFRENYFAGIHIDIGMKKSAIVIDAWPFSEVRVGNEDFGFEFDGLEGAGEWLNVELDDEAVSALLDDVMDVEPAVVVREVVGELAELRLNPQEKCRFPLLTLHSSLQSHPIQHAKTIYYMKRGRV